LPFWIPMATRKPNAHTSRSETPPQREMSARIPGSSRAEKATPRGSTITGRAIYNPVQQRFISEDPLGFRGGDLNLYGYTGNSPTNFRDPSGQFVEEVAMGCLIGAAWSANSYAWSPMAGRKGWQGFWKSAGRGCAEGALSTLFMMAAMGALLGAMGQAAGMAAERSRRVKPRHVAAGYDRECVGRCCRWAKRR
jgi:RHS repeat-associated protein